MQGFFDFFCRSSQPIPYRPVEKYRYYADCGATAVIASHAHVPLGWETYHNVPIFYGLGNFTFPWPDKSFDMWSCGIAVRLFLEKDKQVRFEVIPTAARLGELGADIMPDDLRGRYEKYLESLCKMLGEPDRMQRLWDAWCVQQGVKRVKRLVSVPENFHSKSDLIAAAVIEDMIRCEAHNETMLNFLSLARNRKLTQAGKYIPQLDALKIF